MNNVTYLLPLPQPSLSCTLRVLSHGIGSLRDSPVAGNRYCNIPLRKENANSWAFKFSFWVFSAVGPFFSFYQSVSSNHGEATNQWLLGICSLQLAFCVLVPASGSLDFFLFIFKPFAWIWNIFICLLHRLIFLVISCWFIYSLV